MSFTGTTIQRLAANCGLLAASALLACCSRGTGPTTAQAGPKRVVSFSPAITQMMFDMGLSEQVVGVTRLCELPAGAERPRVGDALSFNSEAILAVRPDVILTQTAAAKFQGVLDVDSHVKVVPLSIESLSDIPAAMLKIGQELGCEKVARRKADAFNRAIQAVEQRIRILPRKRTIFVMGTDRPTAAGAGTFVADMIAAAGGVNVGAAISGQTIWRPAQIEAVIAARPDVLICQVSPGREAAAKAYWMQWKDIPAATVGQVYVVSDPDWSIPGPNLARLLPKLAAMIHGEPASSTGVSPASGTGVSPVQRTTKTGEAETGEAGEAEAEEKEEEAPRGGTPLALMGGTPMPRPEGHNS
jgi:iron complex transport system substrate-binding protein